MQWILVIVTCTLFAISFISTCIVYIGTPPVGSFEGSYFAVSWVKEQYRIITLGITVKSYCGSSQKVPVVEDRLFRIGKIMRYMHAFPFLV